MKSHNAEALAHVESAIKALLLEAYSVTGTADLPQLDHVTISEDLKRIDCAIGPKGESIFARIADRIDEAYVELLALREAIQSGADRAPHLAGDRFKICKSIFGHYISTEMPPGCDMIVVFANANQHIPVWIGMPHQLYVRTARELLSKHGGDHLTIVPYRNAHKFDVEASDLADTEGSNND